jgi:probable H4MPT-linked C1 transfer pathway protein
MSWLALDIGGANLKAADGHGWVRTVPFALWKNPAGLAEALTSLLNAAPSVDQIAVTMTGELCDCFVTKASGVGHIVDAAQTAAGSRNVSVYLLDGRLVSLDEARECPQLAAASNWHALAHFVGRFVENEIAVLVDIGSTTTDIIPLVDGLPHARGSNDTDRLLTGELVYTGVGRSPICAITPWLPWRGKHCPVAAELFATAADAYVLLECIAEQADDTATADGRPLTRPFAHARLARMICCDASDFGAVDALHAAQRVQEAQLLQLERALRQVSDELPRSPTAIVTSGSGEFLARRLVEMAANGPALLSLSERLGPAAAVCATAHALAVLSEEGIG